MRLVKINDIILNLDRIVVIKGEPSYEIDDDNDRLRWVNVKAYVESGNSVLLGRCNTQEDYQELVNTLYKEFSEQFIGDVIIEDDDEKELWK